MAECIKYNRNDSGCHICELNKFKLQKPCLTFAVNPKDIEKAQPNITVVVESTNTDGK